MGNVIYFNGVKYNPNENSSSYNTKVYYVIQNNNGDFFNIDNPSGGYPYFTENFEYCKRFESKESAESFLNSDYVTKMFKKEFAGCCVRTMIIMLLDEHKDLD